MADHARAFALALLWSLALTSVAHASGWSLTFDEQFHGTTLDRSVWATRLIYEGESLDHLNDEAQRYRDNDNHQLKDDALNLIARKTASGWESGMVRSRQTFYFGYFEARVKLPHGRGVWPAFWLNPDYNIDGQLTWPPEIDVFEYPINERQDTANMFHSAASTYPKGAEIQYAYTDPTYSKTLKDYIGPQPLNEGWHVFGLLWLPDSYTVFLDGRKIYTRAFEWLNGKGQLASPAHILLNFAVGGQWPGRYGIDAAQFPQAFSIDYVRVCQYLQVPNGRPDCPRSSSTPDLSHISYVASADLKKPFIAASTVEPASGERKAESGSPFLLKTRISNLTSLPRVRALTVSLRPANANGSKTVAILDLPKSALLSDAPQSFAISFSVPELTPPGTYDVMLSIAAPPNTEGGGKPGFTPVSCGGGTIMPKVPSCLAGNIDVPGPAGKPR